MVRVGLTGGIGSGKSTVARIFEVIGIPVFYADTATRVLVNEDPLLKKAIMEEFGDESYGVDGKMNRSFIAKIVFNDPAKLAALNAITHPAAMRASDEWMKGQVTSYSIKEAALLFESGSNKQLDFIIGVASPLPLRLARIMKRDRLTESEVLQRMSRQMNEEEKLKLCDAVIINDEQSSLIQQVLDLDRLLKRKPGQ